MLSLLMIIPAFVTATITAFLCGILLKFGYVSFGLVFAAILIGDMISNIFWYTVGRVGGKVFMTTFGRLFGITQEHLVGSMDIFNKFKNYVVFFVSAPTGMAITAISLMDAGIRKMTFSKYLISNTLVSAIWVWMMLALGYGFGYAYMTYSSIIERGLVSAVLLVILFILITFGGWIRMIMVQKL